MISRNRSLIVALVIGIGTWGATAACAQPTGSPPLPPLEFVLVQPGAFVMGCSAKDIGCDGDEKPAHEVRITKPFEMGKYEVTQGQWQAVMGKNPSHFAGDEKRPVERVSWDDVQDFLRRLNARKDGYRYRLPTEAEWEYAARAGTTGPNSGPLDQIAWYQENSGGETHPVGQKRANAWGLHDMQGNVYEWVQDFYADYLAQALTDPAGPQSGEDRVPRGGSWMSTSRGVRTSNRNMNEPDNPDHNIGFRFIREAVR